MAAVAVMAAKNASLHPGTICQQSYSEWNQFVLQNHVESTLVVCYVSFARHFMDKIVHVFQELRFHRAFAPLQLVYINIHSWVT